MRACTIIAGNYLAHARVLAASFVERHPGSTFSVLVIDGDDEAGAEGAEMLRPADIGIEEPEYRRMAAIYDVTELATAVKPWLLRTLLAREPAEAVVYLDPDIEIFEPLDHLAELARERGIVLMPHIESPPPWDPDDVAQQATMMAGAYNLGFIAVGRKVGPFLDWWSERLARECLVAPHRGIFVDQRWNDFVPGLFDHVIERDPSYDVAWWNLQQRELTWDGERYLVNGKPLRFFHFSGFNPLEPYLLSKHQGPSPAILLSDRPVLAKICAEYADKVLAAGHERLARRAYGWGELATGTPMDQRMRRLYREALIAHEREDADGPPNPFAPDGGEAFLAWLNEPVDRTGAAAKVPRYLYSLWEERADLRLTFSDLRWGGDADRFLHWAAIDGRAEEKIPFELIPPARDDEAPPEPEPVVEPERGVNLVGYLRAETGVGEAARQLRRALERAGVPFATLTYTATLSRQEHAPDESPAEPRYDTNLICVNADQLPHFAHDAGAQFFENRYSIGVWWWEVARFPETLHHSFDIVHEVWVGSDHVAEAIAAETPKPVFTLPLPVEVAPPPDRTREELGLPDGFVFLFSFDFFSVFERKNPLGVVEAFTRAFEPGSGPTLVLKSINGDTRLRELEQLRAAVRGRDDVIVLDAYVSAEDKNALMASCDCYVSLHRSEGFGLTIAEAMAYGRPVVATAYSGNLAYMTDENSYLVPYTLRPIGPGNEPYPADAEWAEPDVDEAARLMRHVYEHPGEARERGERARATIRDNHSSERTADFLTERLNEISKARSGAGEAPQELAEPAAETEPGDRGLDRAFDFVTRGPETTINAPSRLGPVGRLGRRLLYRLLRPYTFRQREFEFAVVDSLREAEEASSRTNDLLEQVLTRVDGLSRDLADVHHVQAERFQRFEAAARERSDRLAAQFERLSAELERDSPELTRVAEELRRLSAEVERVAGESARLASEAYAQPYTADAGLLRTTDPSGRETIGYAAGASDGAPGVYLGFEDIFRGPEPFIRERQRVYLDVVEGREPILDIGCGRGEFLDLAAEAGLEAIGVDIDPAMVEHAAAKGHQVEQDDAVEFLERQEDGSFGAIVALHVLEHLPYDELVRVFELVERKLKPGGILVAETVNPHSLGAFKAFWVDPTHRAPIYPEAAVALCRLHGYDSARVLFPNGEGDLERDRREQGEYAVVATRGA